MFIIFINFVIRIKMKFSTKVRYGLRILLQIAIESQKKDYVQGKAIAKAQKLSEAYLEQIMIPLKNAGFVKTARGCSGGYALRKDPSEITVLDLIELFEGPLVLADCVEDKRSCSQVKTCYTHLIWKELSEKFRNAAAEISISDIASKKSINEYII